MLFSKSEALLCAAALLLPAAACQSTAGNFSCLPWQSCWPSLAQWQAFNQTLSGRLRETVMLSSPCFPNQPNYNSTTCALTKQNFNNGTFRQQVYGSMENTEWEQCGTANCYAGPVLAQGETCSLGRMSALYVDAVSPSDIVSTLKFVRQHSIRLVVRNTGHDYLGRSAAANTLALRTFNMKSMDFKATFTPYNCASANKNNIAVIGAGVTAEEAYTYFLTHGMMITSGGCPSVGIAGGFGQAAGHGPLAPTHGLMVDQAVEFDVITTDGVFRTINACNNPDLFWAMRGGGGQSYAILVNYKFQVYPTTQWATYHIEATITNPPTNVTDNAVLRGIISGLASNQTTWSETRVAGYNILSPTSVAILEILPSADDPLGTIKNVTSKFNAFVTNLPGLNITLNEYSVFSDQVTFNAGQAAFTARAGSSGNSVLIPSRLIPKDQFATPEKVEALVDSIINGMQTALDLVGPTLASQVHFIAEKTAPIHTPDIEGVTSTNPAWRNTLWHFVTAAAWLPGQPDSSVTQILAAARAGLEPIKAELSVQAAYTNEADPAEPDWQNVFWGANYGRLLQVKQKWDPDSLLNCWKCVGWLGPEDPMFSCYGDSPVPSVSADSY